MTYITDYHKTFPPQAHRWAVCAITKCSTLSSSTYMCTLISNGLATGLGSLSSILMSLNSEDPRRTREGDDWQHHHSGEEHIYIHCQMQVATLMSSNRWVLCLAPKSLAAIMTLWLNVTFSTISLSTVYAQWTHGVVTAVLSSPTRNGHHDMQSWLYNL